jgi:hypothetical protein
MKDSSGIEDHLSYICYVGESYVEELLTRMHFCLCLLDFHDLQERAGAEDVLDSSYVLGFSLFSVDTSCKIRGSLIFVLSLHHIFLSWPQLHKKVCGTVGLTTVGMFGN